MTTRILVDAYVEARLKILIDVPDGHDLQNYAEDYINRQSFELENCEFKITDNDDDPYLIAVNPDATMADVKRAEALKHVVDLQDKIRDLARIGRDNRDAAIRIAAEDWLADKKLAVKHRGYLDKARHYQRLSARAFKEMQAKREEL